MNDLAQKMFALWPYAVGFIAFVAIVGGAILYIVRKRFPQ